jgi:hypothetical protein
MSYSASLMSGFLVKKTLKLHTQSLMHHLLHFFIGLESLPTKSLLDCPKDEEAT